MTRSLLCSLLLVASGCTSSPCDGATCGACPSSLQVTLVGVPPTATVSLTDGLCLTGLAGPSCAASLPPGTHTETLTVDGVSRTFEVTIEPPPAGCCTCSPIVTHTESFGGDAAAADGGA